MSQPSADAEQSGSSEARSTGNVCEVKGVARDCTILRQDSVSLEQLQSWGIPCEEPLVKVTVQVTLHAPKSFVFKLKLGQLQHAADDQLWLFSRLMVRRSLNAEGEDFEVVLNELEDAPSRPGQLEQEGPAGSISGSQWTTALSSEASGLRSPLRDSLRIELRSQFDAERGSRSPIRFDEQESENLGSPSDAVRSTASDDDISMRVVELNIAARRLQISFLTSAPFRSLEGMSIDPEGFTRSSNASPDKRQDLLRVTWTLAFHSNREIDRAEVGAFAAFSLYEAQLYKQAGATAHNAAIDVLIAATSPHTILDTSALKLRATQLEIFYALALLEYENLHRQDLTEVLGVLTRVVELSETSDLTRSLSILKHSAPPFAPANTSLLFIGDRLSSALLAALASPSEVQIKLACVTMLHLVVDELKCSLGAALGRITLGALNILGQRPDLGSFGIASVRTAFHYDSIDDVCNRICDSVAACLPAMARATLLSLFADCLMPAMARGVPELGSVLGTSTDTVEEETPYCEESKGQLLRLTAVTLSTSRGDIRVPPRVMKFLFALMEAKGAVTSKLVHRATLHAWDAASHTLALSASSQSASTFDSYMVLFRELLDEVIISSTPATRAESIRSFSSGSISLAGSSLTPESSGSIPEGIPNLTEDEVTERVEPSVGSSFARVLRLLNSVAGNLRPLSAADPDRGQEILTLRSFIATTVARISVSLLVDIRLSDRSKFDEASRAGQPHVRRRGEGSGSQLGRESSSGGEEDRSLRVLEQLRALWSCYWSVDRLLPNPLQNLVCSSSVVRLLTLARRWVSLENPPELLVRWMVLLIREANRCGRPRSMVLQQELVASLKPIVQWLPDAPNPIIFDVVDAIIEGLDGEMPAETLIELVDNCADQSSAGLLQRSDSTLDSVAQLVAADVPQRGEQCVQALSHLADRVPESSFLSEFPQSGYPDPRFSDRNPYASFYLHVICSSCLDNCVAVFGDQHRRPKDLVRTVDSLAFADRCLRVAAIRKPGRHQPYLYNCVDNILNTVLSMMDEQDSRVRVGSFEVLASTLDVLLGIRRGSSPSSSDLSHSGITLSEETSPRSGGSFEVEHVATHFDEKAWTVLCTFVSACTGQFAIRDDEIHSACQSYISHALTASMALDTAGITGLSFGHISQLWDAIRRISASPWQHVYERSCWTLCVLVCAALITTLGSQGEGIPRSQDHMLEVFCAEDLFPFVELHLEDTSSNSRFWAAQLLSCYLRNYSRLGELLNAPQPPGRIWRAVEKLLSDCNPEVAALAQDLMKLYSDEVESTGDRESPSQPEAGEEAEGSSSLRVWIPAMPSLLKISVVEDIASGLQGFVRAAVEDEEDLPEFERGSSLGVFRRDERQRSWLSSGGPGEWGGAAAHSDVGQWNGRDPVDDEAAGEAGRQAQYI